MDEKVKEQSIGSRDTGSTNKCDVKRVKGLAYE